MTLFLNKDIKLQLQTFKAQHTVTYRNQIRKKVCQIQWLVRSGLQCT